jgi:RNA polymerase sigma factor (sigma-70 family)
MDSKSDVQLLREYVERGTEVPFAEIVARYTSLVYSAALRQTGSPDAAVEVTQIVFVGLARSARTLAPRLPERGSLAGWLCRSARNISLNLLRNECRRKVRERQAMEQLKPISAAPIDWELLHPVIDDVMSQLSELDYEAVVMRFFSNQDLRSVGIALGITDDAAQKRVSRALNQLRKLLAKRGISSSTSALSTVLSANAVQTAPAGLALSISNPAALAGIGVSNPTVITATNATAMTTISKALIAVTMAATIGVGIYAARQSSTVRSQALALQQQDAQTRQLQQDRDDAAGRLVALEQENEELKNNLAQLPKLRGENARLRSQQKDPTYNAFKERLARVSKLKQRLAETPGAKIPEFRLLEENDYDEAVKGPLDTELDYLQALANLRSAAEFKFITTLLNPALTQYAKENNGQFPTDLAQLQPYFQSPVEDAILQRWEIAPANTVRTDYFGDPIITQRAAVDEDLDPRYAIGLNGFASAGLDTAGHNGWGVLSPNLALASAAKAYQAANNGLQPTDPSQVVAYLTTPEQRDAFQKILKWRQKKQ